MSEFTAAIIQMRSTTRPDDNVLTLEKLVGEAVAKGAHYVQTPEMTGALCRDKAQLAQNLRPESDDLIVQAASALARKHSIFLHIGSTAVAASGGKAANRAYIFARDGSLVETYDKIHMFDVDLDNGESWRESNTYVPGERAALAHMDINGAAVRMGFAVCYDMRFPELFRAQALAGANVLTAPAAFTRQTGEAHWHVLLRARAIENNAFMIAAAQGGVHEDGRETYGHSIVIDPWGRVLAEVNGNEPGVAVAQIEPALVDAVRGKIPNLKNRRQFSDDFAVRTS
ncbi:carbon-nitrogen hydrolase family protein [Aureimonas fodinaquatilis]|uniref:Carbon-nitrogen hydrolase family protein n=1 Tax=Aureimonas fodinaquatilis TaxID=2565783 RepID=A0A5B0E1G1_9HYPH|nr:carbon-nitrogen hydrolase family protein [Aureimonas fodinaquatilis]KAA0971620.1 carbon-nitrogen hydrolase family protein [Aureimonas fodinaquatilis]